MFRAVYESAWYHPVFFWIAGAVLLLAVARRLPFLHGFLVAFGLAILGDATLTGPLSPVPGNTGWATAAAIVFVILGDARYFVLVERVRAGTLTARAWQLALAFSLLVPIASYLPQLAFPSTFSNLRLTFLTYEGMFLVLALGLRAWLPRRLASARAADRSWALRATEFEIVQYGLWVLADVLILRGHDVGFLVRFVPNTMYYVLFLPFAAWSAPQNQKGSWRAAHA